MLSLMISISCKRTITSKNINLLHNDYFEQKVIPILENRCTINCHGLEYQVKNNDFFSYQVDSNYKIKSSSLVKKLLLENFLSPDDHPKFSKILTAPLHENYGGTGHKSINVFSTDQDEDYLTLKNWVSLYFREKDFKIANLPINLTFFKTKVLPVFERNSCFTMSCHSSNVSNDFQLKKANHLNEYSLENLLHNYNTTLGTKTDFINFNFPSESRIITKSIPLKNGGIPHRGGNDLFFSDLKDNDVQTLLSWIELEKMQKEKLLMTKKLYLAKKSNGKGHDNLWTIPKKASASQIILIDKDKIIKELTKPDIKGIYDISSFDFDINTKHIIISSRNPLQNLYKLYIASVDDLDSKIHSVKKVDIDVSSSDHLIDPKFSPFNHNEFFFTKAMKSTNGKFIFDIYKHNLITKSTIKLTHTMMGARLPSFRTSGEFFFSALYKATNHDFSSTAIFRAKLDGSDFHIHGGAHDGKVHYLNNLELPNGNEIRIQNSNSKISGSLIYIDHALGISHNASKRIPFKSLRSPLPVLFKQQNISVRDFSIDHDGNIISSYSENNEKYKIGKIILDNQYENQTYIKAKIIPYLKMKNSNLTNIIPVKRYFKFNSKTSKKIYKNDKNKSLIECYNYFLLENLLNEINPDKNFTFVHSKKRPKTIRLLTKKNHKIAILGEQEIFPDGSFSIEIPSNIPIMFQSLNNKNEATFEHERWFYLTENEKLTFSIPLNHYATRCSGCHGSKNEYSTNVLGRADTVTASSQVMSNWTQYNHSPTSPSIFSSESNTVTLLHDLLPESNNCKKCHQDEKFNPSGIKSLFHQSTPRLTLSGNNSSYQSFINNCNVENKAIFSQKLSRWIDTGLQE